MSCPPIWRVAVPAPINRLFDYRKPPGDSEPKPGIRVRVPFGRGQAVGVLTGTALDTDVPQAKLKTVLERIDEHPVFDGQLVAFLNWAAAYYHYPAGEVFSAALPALLRQGQLSETVTRVWTLTASGRDVDCDHVARKAPRQAALLGAIDKPGGVEHGELLQAQSGATPILRKLAEKGWAECTETHSTIPVEPATRRGEGPRLNDAQQAAVDTVAESLGSYAAHLLHGVTGSGKTEVYLHLVERLAERGEQLLLLVPEIGLTPQLVDRFRDRFAGTTAVLHSGLTDRERLDAWRVARAGAPIVIGTRSAVFAALKKPGLIVVDEEHDGSLKQQEGFRYSARDLAVARASTLNIPIVLGSATPSLETWRNARQGRYSYVSLPERAGVASEPDIRLVDLRNQPSSEGISTPVAVAIERHLKAGNQVLVFLNRRGYAPALYCTGCGWSATCRRCDARLTYHRRAGRLRCHHCGADDTVVTSCPECNEPLRAAGQGTERIEENLERTFIGYPIVRIDRDSTRKRGSIQDLLEQVRTGGARLLVGTQMLTKGHDFPNVTLVAVLNADQGLFGTDFRSNEKLAQLIVQVAGRAGRADRPGEVLVQTAYPEHPLLNALIEDGYAGFADNALTERQAAGWPPYTRLALLRAEAAERELPHAFLAEARDTAELLCTQDAFRSIRVLGPAPAPMERRAGRYRAQLLIQSPHRKPLHSLLDAWIETLETLKSGRRVRWSIDVDPWELM